MSTAHSIDDVKRAQDAFNIARAEAIDAYAQLEISLMFLLTLMIGRKQHHSMAILSRMNNARSRNIVIQKIVDKETTKKYRAFTNSLFKTISEVDEVRNQIVHWHMASIFSHDESTSEDRMHALIPFNPIDREPPLLYKSDIADFTWKTFFVAREASDFSSFLDPDQATRVASWPQSWRDRFLQPLSYPPERGHPQYRTHTIRVIPTVSSRRTP